MSSFRSGSPSNPRGFLLGLGLAALAAAFVATHAPVARAEPAPRRDRPAPRLTKTPRLVQFVEAPFPESEKAAGKGASVVLEIIISPAGAVEAARVIGSAGPAFDAAALEAVKAFVFEPAEIDDKPSPIKIQYKYDFVFREEAPTVAFFSGEVRKRGSGEGIVGVKVRLDTGEEAVTDEQGKFELKDLAPGPHTVIVTAPSLSPLQTQETLVAGQNVAVRYDVELVTEKPPPVEGEDADDMEILVVAPKLTREVVATRIEAEAARRVAGTQGDVLKIVENMPGVARAAVGSGDVVVWGAAPQDTRVYVDGVRVPSLYHFGGLRSVVHSDLVRSVELVPGAYGSAYGRGLGGLVLVDTRDPDDQKLHGSLQADLLDASAALQGRIADKVRVAAAVRRSHLREVLSGAVKEDIQEFFPIPRYHDASARVRYEPSKTEWAEIGGMLSGDQITRVIGGDALSRRSETRDLGFDRLFVRYRREPGDGSRVLLVPWFGRDRNQLTGLYGNTPVELRVDSVLYGLRTSWTGPLFEHLTGTAGLDVEVIQSTMRREGSFSTPPREGDARVFGQPPADQVNADNWKSTTGSVAPHLEADIGLFRDTLHVVPGVRFEPFYSNVDKRRPAEGDSPTIGAADAELSVQPRLSLRYALGPRVLLKAAYGRYRQLPAPEDVSPVFGNPLLGTSHATHYLAGGNFKLTQKISVETTAFYSTSDNLAYRNPADAPRPGEALLNVGQGRSYGMQLLVRRELANGLFGWLAYTMLRSERKDNDETAWRLFDYDQTHVVTALASYDLGKGWEVGARFRAATGYPRTPVIGASEDVRRPQYEPTLGERNSERIPAFYQLDIRGSKRFKIASTELELYLDVQNVTNRHNFEEIAYNQQYSERRYIRGLPILPVAGARWSF